MLTKADIVEKFLVNKPHKTNKSGSAFAPSNIALAKYWGKRNQELNLPTNSSLSISLGNKGSKATVKLNQTQHTLVINNKTLDLNSEHGLRLKNYLDLFKKNYHLTLDVNLPFAAGLASSACVFASIALALNELHQWQLTKPELSMLARLGSGSAARSIETGFVEWHMGKEESGLDSFAEKIQQPWPDFCIGLVIFDERIKKVSSREGMQRTVNTSPLYKTWPSYANSTVTALKKSIEKQDIEALGQTAEQNALSMHATMMSAWPPIIYSTEQTLATMRNVWQLREKGASIYFTQDAGPNLKLLFLENEIDLVKQHFSHLEIIKPFKGKNDEH